MHDAGTPDGRAAIEKRFRNQAAVDPASIQNANSSMQRWHSTAELMKVDTAVDDLLATKDPKFAAYLTDARAKANGKPLPTLASPYDTGGQYLAQKRADFWKSQISKLDVYLSDPSIAQSCQLDSIGVRVASK